MKSSSRRRVRRSELPGPVTECVGIAWPYVDQVAAISWVEKLSYTNYECLTLCTYCSFNAIGHAIENGNMYAAFHDKIGLPKDTHFRQHVDHDVMGLLKGEDLLHRQLELWSYITKLIINHEQPLAQWYAALNAYSYAELLKNMEVLINEDGPVRRYNELDEGNYNIMLINDLSILTHTNKTEYNMTPDEIKTLVRIMREVYEFPYSLFHKWLYRNNDISDCILTLEAYLVAIHMDRKQAGAWAGTRTFLDIPSDAEITQMGGMMGIELPIAERNPFADESPIFGLDDDDDEDDDDPFSN